MSWGVMGGWDLDQRPGWHQEVATIVHVVGRIRCRFAGASRCLICFVDPSVHFSGSMTPAPQPALGGPGARRLGLAPSRDRAERDCWPLSPSLCIGSWEGSKPPLLTVEPEGLVCPTRQTASRYVLATPCTRGDPMHAGQETHVTRNSRQAVTTSTKSLDPTRRRVLHVVSSLTGGTLGGDAHPRHSHPIGPVAGRGHAVVSAHVSMKIRPRSAFAKASSCRSRVRSPVETRDKAEHHGSIVSKPGS